MSRRFRVTVDLVVADDLDPLREGEPRIPITSDDSELIQSFRQWARGAFGWVGIEAVQVKAERA